MLRTTLMAAAVAAALAASAGAYDNEVTHPKINEIAFQKFKDEVARQAPAVKAYARYEFDFWSPTIAAEVAKLTPAFTPGPSTGNEVDLGSAKLNVSVVPGGGFEKTLTGHLKYGGYAADLPVIPQSLRHFYDPTNPDEPWITDLVDATAVDRATSFIPAGKNPRTSAKGWALGLPPQQESPYSLNKGRESFRAYLQTGQPFCALTAWRAIGETMHLLGDMTVPAHVRNDGHPGVAGDLFDKWKSDPYENWVTDATVVACANEPVDPDRVADIAKATTPGELFDILARYTNKNFPSQDTLAGQNELGEHFTNGNGLREYPSPQLRSDSDGFDGDYYFQTDYAGKCLLAHRVWSTRTVYAPRTKPNVTADGEVVVSTDVPKDVEVRTPVLFVTRECVASQAKRLVPLAIAGCVRLLELTVPRLEVEVTGFDGATRKMRGRITAASDVGAVPRQPRAFMVSGQKAGSDLGLIDVAADGTFNVAVPEAVLTAAGIKPPGKSAAEKSAASAEAAKAAAKAPPASWGIADYFPKLPDDLAQLKPQRYLASPPPNDPARAKEFDGIVRSEGGKSVMSFVLTSDPDFGRRWFQSGVQPRLSTSAYCVRIEVREFANRAAAEAHVKTMGLRVPISNDKYAEGLDALGRVIYTGNGKGYTKTYLDERFVVTVGAEPALGATQPVQMWSTDGIARSFAGGKAGGTAAAKGTSGTAPSEAPKQKIRLGIGIELGGFLVKSEEKEFQF